MNLIRLTLMTFTVVFMVTGTLEAYPGYGKKIDSSLGNSCQSCHVVFPKLKLYGRTIREFGYNVPGTEFPRPDMLTKIYRAVPIAVRGKINFFGTDQKSTVSMPALQLLSAGNVANNKVSWWFHKHLVEDNRSVPLNEGMPHESWLQINFSDKIHVRAGMFELPMWFSFAKTKVSEIGYLYYSTSTNEGNFGAIAAPQFGIQANGTFNIASNDEDDWGEPEDSNLEGYNYAISITNGETSWKRQINTFFGRITKKFPGAAVGIFSLTAIQKIAPEADHAHGAEEQAVETESKLIYRMGLDGELNLRGDAFSAYGSLAYGGDVDRNFVGGFAGIDYLISPKIFIFSRLDGVLFTGAPPEEEHDMAGMDMDMDMDHEEEAAHLHGDVISDDAAGLSVGLAYMIVGNIRLGAEYRYGVKGIANTGMIQLQFAF